MDTKFFKGTLWSFDIAKLTCPIGWFTCEQKSMFFHSYVESPDGTIFAYFRNLSSNTLGQSGFELQTCWNMIWMVIWGMVYHRIGLSFFLTKKKHVDFSYVSLSQSHEFTIVLPTSLDPVGFRWFRQAASVEEALTVVERQAGLRWSATPPNKS